MLVSYNWLKEYFKKLPEPTKLADILNVRSYEVEGVEQVGDDYVINIDVLPNRAHDSLCHYGVAKEISTITGLEFIDKSAQIKTAGLSTKKGDMAVDVKGSFCRRYIARQINGVVVKDSPAEIKAKLKSIGQKSINNIVDITNIVMFEIGQPMHAFDRAKLSGNKIIVRNATAGEKILTLDKQDITLSSLDPVIADETGVLAVAGVKGGKKAEVDQNTVNIVLESANFAPSEVRKASKRIAVATESSRRFENEITPAIADLAVHLATDMILKYASTDKTVVYDMVDYYPRPVRKYRTGVSVREANNLLGLKLSERQIRKILEALDFEYEIVKARKKIEEESKKYLGKKYKWGASVRYDAPELFDCSSFTSYLYSIIGIPIPRNSIDQFVFGEEITEKQAEVGDLVFGGDGTPTCRNKTAEFLPGTEVTGGIDHVGIYLGRDQVIHASRNNANGVEITKISTHPNFKNNLKFARIINDKNRFVVTIPERRLDIGSGSGIDLKSTTELIEEIGRVHGYNNIKDQKIGIKEFNPEIEKTYAVNNVIRKTLSDLGFSEVITYSFVKNGEVAPEKPIAEDKAFLRSTLKTGMEEALNKNAKNADLLGLDQIKLFEIGKIFSKNAEKLFLSIGSVNKSGIKKPRAIDSIRDAVAELSKVLGYEIKEKIEDNTVLVEIDLANILEKISTPTNYVNFDAANDIKYRVISAYPFILRDIAVWVPKKIDKEKLLKIINDKSGTLLVRTKLFDVYEKEDKVSYAYRLVFQSAEKTLTDAEINKIMEEIVGEIVKKGWEVR